MTQSSINPEFRNSKETESVLVRGSTCHSSPFSLNLNDVGESPDQKTKCIRQNNVRVLPSRDKGKRSTSLTPRLSCSPNTDSGHVLKERRKVGSFHTPPGYSFSCLQSHRLSSLRYKTSSLSPIRKWLKYLEQRPPCPISRHLSVSGTGVSRM